MDKKEEGKKKAKGKEGAKQVEEGEDWNIDLGGKADFAGELSKDIKRLS